MAVVPLEKRRVLVVVADGTNLSEGLLGAAAIGGGLGFALGGPIGAVVGAGILGALVGAGDRGVLRLPLSLAREQAFFPPSHPAVGEAYGLHPVHETAYVPLAQYHRVVFEQKHRELMRLLAALGARRVRVRVEYGMSLSESGSVGVGSLGASYSEKRSSSSHVDFEEVFAVQGVPHIPDALLWYPHEPTWQGLAERRLHHGTQSAEATLEYESDYGIDTSLVARVEGVGVKLKTKFREFEKTRWRLSVEFGPRASLPW